MKKIILTLLFNIWFISLYSTSQEPDIVIINGIKFFTGTTTGNTPSIFPPHIKNINIASPLRTTATARGYIATWELSNDSLFLVSIEDGKSPSNPPQEIIDYPPKYITPKGVFAYWISRSMIVRGYEHIVFMGTLNNGVVEKKYTPEIFNPPTNYNGKWLYKDSIWNIPIHLQKINDKVYKGKIKIKYNNEGTDNKENFGYTFKGKYECDEISSYIKFNKDSTEEYIVIFPHINDSIRIKTWKHIDRKCYKKIISFAKQKKYKKAL